MEIIISQKIFFGYHDALQIYVLLCSKITSFKYSEEEFSEKVLTPYRPNPLVHVYLALQPSQMKDSASANFILLESYPGCTKLCKNISQSLSLDIFFSCSWDIFAIWPIMSSHSLRWLNLRRYFDFGPIASNCQITLLNIKFV